MAKLPLMPKATAAWLVENTTLTFEQIAELCGLHGLEVQAIADDDAGAIAALSPLTSGQLTRAEIARCEADPKARLKLVNTGLPEPVARPKGARYTPVSKRQDKPDAIAWILKNYPEVTDAQIGKLVGTTKQTINAVRDRTHWNTQNIRQRSPVELGLCSMDELEAAIVKARQRLERQAKQAERDAAKAAAAKAAAETAQAAPEPEPEQTTNDARPEPAADDAAADVAVFDNAEERPAPEQDKAEDGVPELPDLGDGTRD